METKKISKWDAAPESIKNMQEFVNALYDPLPDEQNPIIDALSKVLDDYNKLEAKHNVDCGLISALEADNDYLVSVIEHFNTQLDNLREKLKEAEKSKEKWIARCHSISDICSRDEDDSEMLQAILRKDGYTIEYDGDIDDETIRCQDSFDLRKETTQDEVTYQYGRWTLIRPLNFSEAKANADAAILRNQCSRHIDLLDKLRWALEDKGIYCEWDEAALKWNLRNTANICESWSCKHHFEEELRIRCKEIDDKNKLIEEMRQKIEELESENKSFTFISLKEKRIQMLEKENKDLKEVYKKLKETNKSLRRTVNILEGEGYF